MKNPWDIEPKFEDLTDFRDKETLKSQEQLLARKSEVIQDEYFQPNDAMWAYVKAKALEPKRKAPQLGRCRKCQEWTLVGDLNDSCCGDEYVEIN